MRRQIVAVLLAVTVLGCAGPVSTGTPDPTVQPATAPASSAGQPSGPSSPSSASTGLPTETCIGGLAQATCDQAARVALTAVAPSGLTPTYVWIDSGQLCPTQACLFDPSQSFPAQEPPSGGQWVGNAEIAFTGTDQHAGLNIAQVNGTLVPVLIGYRVPLLTWCTGGCPSSVSTDGNYKLELVLPRLTWNVGDPISGTAILSLTDSQPTKVTGASELIAFAFDEVGGIRHVAPIWAQSCVLYALDPATPQSVALDKSGAFQGNEPDADFLRSFFADPEIHLPAGTWDITAIASFSEGSCGAPTHTIQATVRIHITG
jgi:hypothetical protein